jgi:2-polyprenyl-3-methyl-5-hydroxy-6-metoxy-1,4-benzoquinol methylase
MLAEHVCACGARVGGDRPTEQRVNSKWGPIEIVRCAVCGLAQTREFPDEAQLAQLYAGDAIYGPPLAGGFENGLAKSAHVIEELRTYKRAPAEVLEIGCNAGYGLETFARAGYRVTGIEANPGCRQYIEAQLKHRVVASLDELPAEPKLDVVYMSHVLEHVPDPVAMLVALKQRCNRDALLYIKVPNYAGLHARFISRGAWSGFIPHQHLWYFEKASLAQIARRAGLLLLDTHTRGFSTSQHPFPPRRWFTRAVGQLERVLDAGEELVGVYSCVPAS